MTPIRPFPGIIAGVPGVTPMPMPPPPPMRDYNMGGKVRPAEDEEGDMDLSSLMAYYKPSTYTPNYFSGGMSPMSFPAPTSMPLPPPQFPAPTSMPLPPPQFPPQLPPPQLPPSMYFPAPTSMPLPPPQFPPQLPPSMYFPAPTSMPRPPSMWNYNVGGKLRPAEDDEGAEG